MTTVPTGIPIARGTPSQPPADPEVAGLPLEEPEAGRPRVNVVLIVCLLCLVAGIAYGGYLLKKFRKPKPKVFRIEVQECPPQLGFKVAKGTSKAYHYGQEETEQ